MKSLVASALATSLLIVGCSADALPSIHECARLPCSNDLLFLQGSVGKLADECEAGVYKEGTFHATAGMNAFPVPPKCGTLDGERYRFSPSEFRQVCDCVRDALLPRHCDSISCYKEMLQVAGESLYELRKLCNDGVFKDTSPVTIPLDSFSSRPRCGTVSEETVQFSPEQYQPVCQCVVVNEDEFHPATDLARGGSVTNTSVDVFLHVVVLSESSLRVAKFADPNAIQAEFRHLVQDVEKAGINFTIKSIDLTIDARWATGKDNKGMRDVLHQGDNRDLNFYMLDNFAPDGELIKPIKKGTKIYCTPPVDSVTWNFELITDPQHDGCIVSTGVDKDDVGLEMARWIGICRVQDGTCTFDLSDSKKREVQKNLAYYRYVPIPRAATAVPTLIEAETKLEEHCQHVPCYKELQQLFGKKDGDFHEQCRTGDLNSTEDLTVVGRPTFTSDPTCGIWAEDRSSITFRKWEHRPSCDCLTRNDRLAKWPYTTQVLVGLEHTEQTIFIDIFIHLVAASLGSPLAFKFKGPKVVENEFNRVTRYFKDTKIKFRFKSVKFTVNAAWANGKDSARMRQALYMGGNRDLNLYFLEVHDLDDTLSLSNKTEAYCTFPYSAWWEILSTAEPEHDGCIITLNARAGKIATAMQSWLGNTVPVPTTCEVNECGPVFQPDDISMINALVVLNRAVPVTSTHSRLRLYEALSL